MTVPAATVTQYYTGIFRQAPSAAVSAAYQAMTDANTALNSMLSAANVSVDPVVRLYQTSFNRVPDSAGMTAWVVPFSTGQITLASIANGFTQSTEFTTLYPTTMSNAQFVGALYWNILQRQGDAAGMNGWIAALNSGALTRSQVLLGFSESAEFIARIEPKVDSFLTGAANNTATYTGSLFDQGGGTSGTYVLTPNADIATAPFFDGSLAITAAGLLNTLNNADQLTGGVRTDDRLYAVIRDDGAAGATTVSPTLSLIEVIDIEAQDTNGAVTLNMVNSDTSVTTVRASNTAAGGVAVSNLNSVVANYAVASTAGNFTATVNSTKMTGTTDAATVTVSNVANGAANVTIDIGTTAASTGYETVSFVSTGSIAANLVTFNSANTTALATVNASGATALTLSLDNGAAGGLTAVNVVNGSAMTAALTLTVDANNAQNMSITGGSANDVINMNGTYTSSDTINGGTGTDRLTLTNAEATGATAVQANVSNIEVIGLSDGINGTVTVSNFAATGLRFGADMANAGTVNYAAGTNSLDLQNRVSGGFALTANVAGSATTDILNMTLGSSTAGDTFGAGNVVINGAESVNLTVQGGAGSFGGTFTMTDTAANQVLTITGSQAITFTGAVRADTINASGMTGTATLTLTGGTGTTATVITGTANADAINGSTAGDLIDGGAGADTIANVLTGTNATASDVLTGGAGFDTFILRGDQASAAGGLAGQYISFAQVTDFTVGSTAASTDILQLSATIGNYSGGSAFFAGVAAAAAGSTSIQSVAQNAAAAAIVTGTDLIKLTTGVATTGLQAQQAYAAAIGTATVTGFVAGNDIFVAFYDTTNSRMVVALADTTAANTVLDSGDTITVIGSISMTAADFASFNQNNLSIINA